VSSIPTRLMVGAAAVAAAVLIGATPTSAHSEFQPDSAGAGSTPAVQLFVENEQPDSGTVEVQLHFPEDQSITLADLPDAPGWTSRVEGGTVGGPVTDIVWTRPSAEPEDVLLPLTLGPLPAQAARLQFKVLQSYANGTVDRWIEDWPADAPEPEMPGPIFTVTGGAVPTTDATAGTSEAPTSTVTGGAAPTTEAPTETTQAPTSTVAGSASATEDDGDDSNTWIPIAIAVAAAAVLGVGVWYYLRRRRTT
jgi:Domain of unkown function (DUF1775)